MATKTKRAFETIHLKLDSVMLAALRLRAQGDDRTLHNLLRIIIRDGAKK